MTTSPFAPAEAVASSERVRFRELPAQGAIGPERPRSGPLSILMCRPEFFGVEYEINPWMHVENRVDNPRARAQWQSLYDTYLGLGQAVELLAPVKGLPDMVFTANAGVVWDDHVVLTRFHHHQRQGEEPYFQRFFQSRHMKVILLDDELSMEGAGDFLFVGNLLFAGYGFRTDEEAHRVVAQMLGVDVVSLHLIDDRFYHLDTCFSPLDDHTVLVNPRAFTPESLERIRAHVPRVIEVPEEVAAGFACNATTIGNTIISSTGMEPMVPQLREFGFDVICLEMNEFMKAGGGVRCLTLPLDIGRAMNQVESAS